jgi:hypothetical protein
MITEAEILAGKPYGETAPEPTVEDRANDLVNAIMHQLRTEQALRYPIDEIPEDRKAMIHARLVSIALISLRGEALVELPEIPEPQAYEFRNGELVKVE